MPQERFCSFKKEVFSIKVFCNGNTVSFENLSRLKRIKDVEPIQIRNKNRFLKEVKTEVENKKRVVVMGGDGTINLVLKKVIEANADLGIIPSGRGNDFAHFLGIPENIEKAVQVIERGNSTKVSVGKVGEDYFCNSLGIGFDALVVDLANKSKSGYRLTAAKSLLNFKSFPATVEAETKKAELISIEDNLLMAAFINGETEGGKIKLGKPKEPGELFLTMVLIREVPKFLRPVLFSLFLTPLFKSFPGVQRFKIKKATLVIPERTIRHVDGDLFYKPIKKISVSEKKLSVLI